MDFSILVPTINQTLANHNKRMGDMVIELKNIPEAKPKAQESCDQREYLDSLVSKMNSNLQNYKNNFNLETDQLTSLYL